MSTGGSLLPYQGTGTPFRFCVYKQSNQPPVSMYSYDIAILHTNDQGQSREEYDKSLGRQSDESSTDYVSRTTGICALYFSILSTPLISLVAPPSSLGDLPIPTPTDLPGLIPECLRLPAAWTWLSHALQPPIPSLLPAAQLLTTWIEICAFDVGRIYGAGQLGKVMRAILREGVPAAEGAGAGEGEQGKGLIKGDSKAALQRLGVAAKEWHSRGAPEGREWA